MGLKSEFSALLGGFCQQTGSTYPAWLYRQALGRSHGRHCYKQGVSRADATVETFEQERPYANVFTKRCFHLLLADQKGCAAITVPGHERLELLDGKLVMRVNSPFVSG